MPKVEDSNVVRKMSLMNNKIYHLAGSYEFLELTTLLMQETSLEEISSGFFNSMPKLVVLDLSNNRYISELPDGISKLVSLQYLNLSGTGITHLSMSLQQLKKLIHLDMRKTRRLSSIAGISSLHNLKVLKFSRSDFSWDLDVVKELESLEHLDILAAEFVRPQCFEHFLSSHRLMSCTRSIMFIGYSWQSSKISLPAVTMDKLCDFSISECHISEIKMGNICIEDKTVSPLHNPRRPRFLSLTNVAIMKCQYLRELTFLMFAPNLRSLYVRYSDQLEDIINKEKAYESEIVPFPKLSYLKLVNLPELKNIYWSPLRFPCLEIIHVIKCPSLKKLPLDSQSGRQRENGLIIRYSEKKWFDGVNWEDEATKTRFLLSCPQPSNIMDIY